MFFPLESEARNIERVSLDNNGVEGNNDSSSPSISSNGRYVAFRSYADNLVSGDGNNAGDVFVYDRDNDTIEMVSVNNSGVEGHGDSSSPSISSDGRYVAFESAATNLVTLDANASYDVFVSYAVSDTSSPPGGGGGSGSCFISTCRILE